MKKVGISLLLFLFFTCLLFPLPAQSDEISPSSDQSKNTAAAAEQANADAVSTSPPGGIILKTDRATALVENKPVTMPAAPLVKKNVTLVPLRFLAETMGLSVDWNDTADQVTINARDKEIVLSLRDQSAVIADDIYRLDPAPCMVDNSVMVPLRFVVTALGASVDYRPDRHEIIILPPPPPPPPPNRPPVAKFSVNKTTVAQGETVIYTDESYDPDGDKLVAEQWTGRKRAFFQPGEYTVSLRVEDDHGNWSEPAQVTITVTSTVLMDEVTYNLKNPLPGEPMNISTLKNTNWQELTPAVAEGTRTLLMSDSPEKITSDGILYMDTVSGPARIFFHHTNESTVDRQVYVVAANPNSTGVDITLERQATAGPGDPMSMGRAGTRRFLRQVDGTAGQVVTLSPGQYSILYRTNVPPGQTVHGIFDLSAAGPVSYYIITVSSETTSPLLDLPLLPADNLHTRGTFKQCDRRLSLQIPPGEFARLTLADGKSDPYLTGRDAVDNTTAVDRGNYGLLYELDLSLSQPTGILASPRGGAFAGAMRLNGETFTVPGSGGVLTGPEQAAMIGVPAPHQPIKLWFMPPSGSHLPISLYFIPIK